jgi:hypothetical protein
MAGGSYSGTTINYSATKDAGVSLPTAIGLSDVR